MDKLSGLTVKEIAEILSLGVETTKARIRLLGIKELYKVGGTNVYDPSVVDLVKYSKRVGRPSKPKPEPEPETPVKKGGRLRKPKSDEGPDLH